MANIPMKDIQFPGLDDTYTFAQVDATLTTQGKAADAKKTGDEISELKNDFTQVTGVTPIKWTDGGYISTAAYVGSALTLTPIANANFSYVIVNVSENDIICVNGVGVQNAYLWTFIDSENIVLSKSTINAIGNDLYIVAPENASKLVLNSSITGKGFCFKGEAISKRIDNVDVTGNGKKHKIVAGVVRNTGNGWEFIVDANHQGDLNCLSASTDANGRLVIDYSGIQATKVISFSLWPDEAFAQQGYICGSSVGRDKSYIDICKYEPVGVCGSIKYEDGNMVIDENSNNGLVSATWDSTYGRLSIAHNAIDPSETVPTVIPAIYGNTLPRLYSKSGTSFTLEFLTVNNGAFEKVMTPGNGIAVNVQRMSPTKLKLVKQDASQIVSSAGNFWFMGIFQTD